MNTIYPKGDINTIIMVVTFSLIIGSIIGFSAKECPCQESHVKHIESVDIIADSIQSGQIWELNQQDPFASTTQMQIKAVRSGYAQIRFIDIKDDAKYYASFPVQMIISSSHRIK